MKYIRFKGTKNPDGCFGRIDGNTVKILKGCIFKGSLEETGESVALESIKSFLPPVNPPNIIAIGANYVDHCKECAKEPPKLPLVFIKATNSLTAHNENIIIPKNYPDAVDYEAELAVVIGKRASYVSEKDAMDYVLGFTCANDVSARDVQLKIDSQWARGKSFDTFCPLGPYLVTGIKNPKDLHIKLRLNGKQMQDQPVSDMIFSISRIIAHLSAGMTLLPGTVILSGTPSGVGMAMNPQRFLKNGDLVEVEIDQIGVLSNRVVSM
jgi:2-keto-4-pentenoate hydratase/2-oxohepta-3-ene-1,7-dioic acid hydratase in catechol pathway